MPLHKQSDMFNLPHVPSAKQLIDKAARQGSLEAKKVRSKKIDYVKKQLEAEQKRIRVVGSVVEGELKAVVENYPSYDQLNEFYKALFELRVGKDRYKKSLGRIQGSYKKVCDLKSQYIAETKKTGNSRLSKEYLGRVCSIIDRISKELDYLIEVKKTLKKFPTLKGDAPTIVVAGYPNVGKSTFMKTLTKSRVKTASYPFTTVGLLLGYKKNRYQDIQIVDSPGLLDRGMQHRNKVELQAILALSHLADVVLFLIDPMQDISPQKNLYTEVKSEFHKPVVVAVNKCDAAEEDRIKKALKEFSCKPVCFSAQNEEECGKLFEICLQKREELI
ncbi:MAG: GTP-binding protein [Candidatus Altiarchaeales archaeon]|nr:GTP-binding protein [Candidatus Altiarchaeales archaeon]